MSTIKKPKRVVVIGAGIGGLASANLLAKAGYEVSVYERLSQPGGRAGVMKKDGFTFDTGPSWYLMPEVFEHYYQLLDQTVSQHLNLHRLQPAYRVFYEDSTTLTITGDLDKDATSFEEYEVGSGDALRSYVNKSTDIYKTALQHFLYTNFSRTRDLFKLDIIRRSISLLVMSFMPLHQYVACFVRSQKLQQILEYPMVFLGASPFQAPALYSLMSALDFTEGVYYPKGGLHTIISSLERIGKELGVSFHYESDVSQILTRQGVTTGIKLKTDQVVEADIIISNADIHHTEQSLLKKSERSYRTKYWKRIKTGPSAVLVYIGLNKKIPQLAHHNLLFLDKWQESFRLIENGTQPTMPASMYICNPSKSDKSVAPKGCENIFILIPIPSASVLPTAELENFVDQYLSQIEETIKTPIRNCVITKHIYGPDYFQNTLRSHKASMLGASHILRQSAFFRTKNYSKKVKNLYFVGGNTTPGIGLPMCLIGAEMLFKRITGDKRSGRLNQIVPVNWGVE